MLISHTNIVNFIVQLNALSDKHANSNLKEINFNFNFIHVLF